jgi:hypothetical protein
MRHYNHRRLQHSAFHSLAPVFPGASLLKMTLLFTLAPSGLLPVSKAILQITQEAIGPFVLFNITHSVSNIFGINYSASMQASLL